MINAPTPWWRYALVRYDPTLPSWLKAVFLVTTVAVAALLLPLLTVFTLWAVLG